MAVLMVTYDLHKGSSGDDYEEIISIIKSGGNWARLSESCYAVNTETSPSDLFERVKVLLRNGDKFMIFTATSPYFGQHSKEVIDWLGKKFT